MWKSFGGTARFAKERGVHVEVTTLVIPTVNDDETSLRSIAKRIVEELGQDTPWHVTAYYPAYLFDAPPTPVRTLEKAYRIGREEGLKFVYLGNVPGHPYENTYCPKCETLLIRRYGVQMVKWLMEETVAPSVAKGCPSSALNGGRKARWQEVTSRERVIAAIEFSDQTAPQSITSPSPGAFWRHGQKLVELLNEKFPDDFGSRFSIPPEPESGELLIRYTDEWGSEWVMRKGYTIGEVKKPAIDDWSKWKDYKFPPLPPESHFESLKARIEESGHRFYVLGSGGTLFERMQWLRGPENLFMDLAEDREELHELADRIVDWNINLITLHQSGS